ncbi:MAG: hypothetical protein VB075_11015, partial [Petrimonas sp.]|uniref:hypothetical protein n=1 Tax=Petrimonas sp. TaxID=2023866 RepID=UPI002B3DBF7F|nr:hypothetical protein [Petrimonas sp.]
MPFPICLFMFFWRRQIYRKNSASPTKFETTIEKIAQKSVFCVKIKSSTTLIKPISIFYIKQSQPLNS